MLSPLSSIRAISRATADAPRVPSRSSNRRSHRSAMAPDSMPRRKKGNIRAAAPTPTINSEPVSSKMSHPTDTCSIPVAREYRSVAPQRRRKSLMRKETAQFHIPLTAHDDTPLELLS